MGNSIKNLYKILGISETATSEEIKKAFHKKARNHHPDKNEGKETQATEEMKLLNEAFGILRDPAKKCGYDKRFNAYFKTTVQDERFYHKDDTEEFSRHQYTHNFFRSDNPRVFNFEAWLVKHNDHHLFIYHPTLNGYKDNITFWSFNTCPVISLPINNSSQLARTLQTRLSSIIPIRLHGGPGNDEIEVSFKLPVENTRRYELLNVIFDLYNLPSQVSDFVKTSLGMIQPELVNDNLKDISFNLF